MEQTTNAYWGMLIYDKVYCPFCGGHLRLRQQKYVKKPTTDSDYEEMDAHDYYCSNCKIGLVQSIYFDTYNYSVVNRYDDITNKKGLSLQRTKNFLTLSNDNWKNNKAFEIKSTKENRKPDEVFEIIFCNERRSTLKLKCSLLYWNLKSLKGNYNDNIKDVSVFKLWGDLIQKYLPYGQSYQIPINGVKTLCYQLYKSKSQKIIIDSDHFQKRLRIYLISIIEKAYFEINDEAKYLYKELKKSRKEGNLEKEREILNLYKDNYIKESIYLDSPLYVNIYNNTYHCESYQHRTEERTGFVVRVQDLSPVPINLHYCKNCRTYSISRDYYDDIKSRNRVYLFNIADKESIQQSAYDGTGNDYQNLQAESIYMKMGYSVGKTNGMSYTERKQLIISFLESGFTTKARFSAFIEWLIRRNRSKMSFVDAVSEWESDLRFINNYNLDKQEQVYASLVFRRKRTVERLWKGEPLYDLLNNDY